MKIAIEGCAHGELDTIYETIKCLEESQGFKIDLLICCGDFQSARNEEDLRCMAIPPKYYNIGSFHKYYSGEKVAPILTLFIGGNHEASNYLQELPYGGWVAHNIYYMGYAGVVNIAGVRIGGISGIYKPKDYMKGHFEMSPYDENRKRSVYHIRNLEVFRLKQISEPINIFLSHDWPTGVWKFGNQKQLMKFKPHFIDDINTEKLGGKPLEDLLNVLKPDYWFAAHLHCKFAAVIPHDDGQMTKFLALDKCLPRRRFLQVIDVPHDSNLKTELSYDLEWLTILNSTNHLLSVKNIHQYMPSQNGNESFRWCFSPTAEEKSVTLLRFNDNLLVPKNFEKTAPAYVSEKSAKNIKQPLAVCNPQTVALCKTIMVDDPVDVLLNFDLSANLTINDTSQDSLDVSSTTFVSDTDASLSVTPNRSLRLPEPVANNEPDDSEDYKMFSRLHQPSYDETGNEEQSEDSQTQAQPPEKSSVKKFKRRNGEMYEKNEMDEF